MSSRGERAAELRGLVSRLEIHFDDLALLDRALTHASISCESDQHGDDYESLEFLGDAALGLAIADHLLTRVPDRTPGDYSRMRAAVVNRRCLARVAQALEIPPAIRLGKGEETSGGRRRVSLRADCLEAVIGALYLDQGWDAVREFVGRVFQGEIERAQTLDKLWDYKSRLQHYCQTEHIPLPLFDLVRSEGPDHQKEFEIEVILRGEASGRGIGTSKKEAEQNAAKAALETAGLLVSAPR